MFAHVSPEAGSFGETISTLKFAQRVSSVDLGAASMNKESHEVIELKEQVDMSAICYWWHMPCVSMSLNFLFSESWNNLWTSLKTYYID